MYEGSKVRTSWNFMMFGSMRSIRTVADAR
jgi:hypothetical protein